MNANKKWMVVAAILLILRYRICNGCLEQERVALLNLKPVFQYSPAVQSWFEGTNSSSNCCAWEGVRCNYTTGRVVAISIRTPWNYAFVDLVDASLFRPFEQLQSLDLSGNGISNWIDNEDCRKTRGNDLHLHDHSSRTNEGNNTAILNGTSKHASTGSNRELRKFSSLEFLDLSHNMLHDTFAPCLAAFPSLKHLNLAGNFLREPLEISSSNKESRKFSNLEFLDLSHNMLGDSFVPCLVAFPSLKHLNLAGNFLREPLEISNLSNVEKLEYLNLDRLNLGSDFLDTIGVMTSLRNLSLHGCGLQGTLPSSKGLCNLLHLEELDISDNGLTGTLPWCFTNLTFMKKLDISFNHFFGDISVSFLTRLISIELLNISDNHFQIPSSFSPLSNHSKLKYLEAQNNEIYVDMKTQPFLPKFQLLTLNLVLREGYAASFPEFLYYQHELLQVDISNMKMIEGAEYWLIKNNTRLKRLVLLNCSLSGPLQLPPNPHEHLSYLDISENLLNGTIPEEIGTRFPQLTFLNMSRNSFEGGIPASIGNLNLLIALDLSNNQVSGGVPQALASGCFSLSTLVLSNNKLQGKILPFHSNWRNLSQLLLDNNFFIGEIASILQNSSKLVVLDVSDNQLSGGIPEWMGRLNYLQVLDLSRNYFNGTLPVDFNPPSLSHMHLTRNRLQGPLVNAFANCSYLMTLDLSHNEFGGEISSWIGIFFGSLNYLLLNNNKFEGGIPIHFCSFFALSLIDLSHNNLSGEIFPCLNDYPFGENVASVTRSRAAPPLPPPEEPLRFTTKNNSYPYSGKILKSMSGIDLSCNNLTGEIPAEIGILIQLISFNVSHNSLTGEIPTSIAYLTEIESLDLSYNSLSGEMPSQITRLYNLAVFTVAYNNLSGKTPDQVAQFGTFDNDSYKGNPFLCGLPLSRHCNPTSSPIPPPPTARMDEESNDSIVDGGTFLITFWVTYICALLGVVAVMIINPRWRRNWICFVETTISSCYYFVIDNISRLFKPRVT